MSDNPMDRTTPVQRALKMEGVPESKWREMAQRTFLGALFVGLGLASATVLGWGMWPSIGLCVFGSTVWSRQIITGSVTEIIPLLKAVAGIIRGKGDA